MESGDQSVMDEMVLRLGVETIAEVVNKDRILENTPKPDPAADKEAGVPAIIAFAKKDIYNKIPKVFTPSKKSRARWGSTTAHITFRRKDDEGGYEHVLGTLPEHKLILVDAFSKYPDLLQEFVSKLAAVKSADDLAAFWKWYRTDTYSGRGREFTMPDGGTMHISEGIFGVSDYEMPRFPGGWGRSPAEFASYMNDQMTKDEYRSESKEARDERRSRFHLYLTDQRWWDKALGVRKEVETGTDTSHGNFVPMEHIRRTAPAIPAARVKVETLQSDFGFKSVQFGHWMDDVTAKEHIRHTIGALEDIGTALNLDLPKLINDLGLSIAYGARGGGKFLAHYESTRNIINLTKSKGDGSFFHEFTHFLDFTFPKVAKSYRNRWSSKKDSYSRSDRIDEAAFALMQNITGEYFRTEREFKPGETDENVQEEVRKLYEKDASFEDAVKRAEGLSGWQKKRWLQDVADMYRKPVKAEVQIWNEPTKYITDSGKVGGDYWTRPEELLARAAQAYIEDKMAEKGMVNDYVTRTTISKVDEEDLHKILSAYPQGEERVRFNKAFDVLLAAVRAKYPRGGAEVKFKTTGIGQQTMSEAAQVLIDYKNRLKIDFDVQFIDSFLVRSDPAEAARIQGATADNTVVLLKQMAAHTAEHELVHLTMANLDRIEAFRSEGITREKLLEAQAIEDGISVPGNVNKLEESIALGFEQYVDGQEKSGILRKFFAVLKRLMTRFLTAVRASKGDILRDYYETLHSGQSVDTEMIRLENKGIVEAFTEDGQFDIDDTETFVMTHFKIEESEDKRLQDIAQRWNETKARLEAQQAKMEGWYGELQEQTAAKETMSEGVAQTPEEIKRLARFRERKPPGAITERGKLEVSANFENPQAAMEQLSDYLKRKTDLIETRNRLRQIRRELQQAKTDKRLNAANLRDLQRRLNLRIRNLERNDFYIDLGRIRGSKEGIKFVMQRRSVISQMAGTIGLTNKKMRELVAGRHIETMTEGDFNDYLIQLANRAKAVKAEGLAKKDVVAMIISMQFKNADNLRQAMKLPTIGNMTQEQAESFMQALSGFQVGDIFLTRRELETIHRTDWGGIKTQRELTEKLEQHTGVPRGGLSTLRPPELKGFLTSWISLSRQHPFWKWLVNKRFEASIVAEREYHAIENEIYKLTNAARRSRNPRLSMRERLVQAIVPTDAIIAGYLEAEDKLIYAEREKMTPEELALGNRLIALYHTAYEYLSTEYGMEGRRNYMTHVRRSFLETIKDEGFKVAIKEAFDSQRENETAFNILDSKTGQILAFEKFMGYTQQRHDIIVPTMNIARATTAYFRAFTRKKALDAFIPDAMLAVHAHKVLTGQTAKGLDKDPRVETFVKRWLNDAKGRKIDILGIEHGAKPEVGLRMATTLVSLKYLGFNLATGLATIIGDHVAVFRALTVREAARGAARTLLRPFQSWKLTGEFRSFLGRNPLIDLFSPEKNLPSRIKDLAMVFFALGAYQSEKFYLRAKLTEEEFDQMVASDARLTDLARELSKWKRTKFYIPSLVGSTTFGKATLQFGSWAAPIFNTTLSDIYGTLKAMKTGSFKKLTESEQARQLLKTGIHIAIAVFLAHLMVSPDDDDDSLWARTARKAKREIMSLFQALQFITDPRSWAIVVRDLVQALDVLKLIASQEKYKQDGEGYIQGDAKWIEAAKRAFTPMMFKQFWNKEERSAKDEMIDEASKTGDFDAAALGEFLNPEKWAETGEEADKYRARKIAELTVEYNAKRKYPESRIAEIISTTVKNADRIAAMMEYANDVGIDAVEKEVKELRGDKDLFTNPAKRTGGFVSSNLYSDFLVAARRFRNAPGETP